jgi:hypothetical protein
VGLQTNAFVGSCDFRAHKFLDYMRQHNTCIAIGLVKVTVFGLDLSWIKCSSRYFINNLVPNGL